MRLVTLFTSARTIQCNYKKKKKEDGRALFYFLQEKHCSPLSFFFLRGLLFVHQVFYCFSYLGDIDVVIIVVNLENAFKKVVCNFVCFT